MAGDASKPGGSPVGLAERLKALRARRSQKTLLGIPASPPPADREAAAAESLPEVEAVAATTEVEDEPGLEEEVDETRIDEDPGPEAEDSEVATDVQTFVEGKKAERTTVDPENVTSRLKKISESNVKPLDPPPSPLQELSPAAGMQPGAVPEKVAETVTSPRPLVEPTPAPLPPSPADEDSEAWFEEAPTRPSALSDIAGSSVGVQSSSKLNPLPGVAPDPESRPEDSSQPKLAQPTLFDGELPRVATATGGRELPSWLIPALSAVTALVVGMVIGAFLFRSGGGGGGEERSTATPAVTPPSAPCPEPMATTEVDVEEDAGERAGEERGDAASVEAVLEAPTAPPPPQCALQITSRPPGAEVALNGTVAGETPAGIPGLVCNELVTVQVSRDGFLPWRRRVKPRAGKPIKIHAALRRPTVAVSVRSSPPGARVLVDGKASGKTPTTTRVVVGRKITVKLTKFGYEPFTTTVLARRGASVDADLEKVKKKGFLGKTADSLKRKKKK